MVEGLSDPAERGRAIFERLRTEQPEPEAHAEEPGSEFGGELANRLTHPRYSVARTYRAKVKGALTGAALSRLSESIGRRGWRGLSR